VKALQGTVTVRDHLLRRGNYDAWPKFTNFYWQNKQIVAYRLKKNVRKRLLRSVIFYSLALAEGISSEALNHNNALY